MIRHLFGPEPHIPNVLSYKHPHDKLIVVAGPCSVESHEQIEHIAYELKGMVTHLRGGVFRAGTYPPDTFGESVVHHDQSARSLGIPYIEEWVSMEQYQCLPEDHCIQIGSRQMQNYEKLKFAAEMHRPVFLKRNQGATLGEFLGAAEYLLKYGCKELYLIERGSSTFAQHVRWDLSMSMIPAIHAVNPELKVIVDASHGTGRRDLVAQMTFAGMAAGADGFLVEVHPTPGLSLSDAEQAYPLKDFRALYDMALNHYSLAQMWKKNQSRVVA